MTRSVFEIWMMNNRKRTDGSYSMADMHACWKAGIEAYASLERPQNNSKPTLAIDFDGVIHRYSQGWHDGSIYDEPQYDCVIALQQLSKKYRIVIFSTRNYDRMIDGKVQSNQVEEMTDWLNKYQIPYDKIHTEPTKPICKLFIDDNAYRFENWGQCLDDVAALVPVGDDQ